MGAPAGKPSQGAAVTCRASTIKKRDSSGWLCLHPPGPCYSVTWERSSHREPETNTEPPEWSFQCGRLLDLVFIRAAYLPKGTRVGPSGPLACPKHNSKKQFPKQAPPGGPAKNQEWGPQQPCGCSWSPKGHRALLGPVANFALPCRPQGSRR